MTVADLPAVRDQLIHLLGEELSTAWERAISQGVTPDKLAAAVDRSRDTLRDMASLTRFD